MMKKISSDANLSKIYTNHCLRATASKGLADAGNERADIRVITGHVADNSLDPYVQMPSDTKKLILRI